VTKWQIDFGVSVSTPCVGEDGTVFLGCADGTLLALSPNGTTNWVFDFGLSSGNRWVCSPALAKDQTVYALARTSADPAPAATGTWRFVALSRLGALKWEVSGVGKRNWISDPAVGPDETVYFAVYDYGKQGWLSSLFAYSPSGQEQWRCDGTDAVTSFAIAADGTVYGFGQYAAGISAYSPFLGLPLWTYNGGASAGGVIGHDGTIYTAMNGNLYAVSPDGTLRWSNTTLAVGGVPAIGADGTIYAIGSMGLYEFYPYNGTINWNHIASTGSEPGSPVIGPDGRIVVGGRGNAIHFAFCGAANTAWPMVQRNARHTGRAGDAVPVRPCLSIVRFIRSRGFEFSVTGDLGARYALQTSTNLWDWQTVLAYVNTNATRYFIDSASTNLGFGFYRVLAD
jgi:predicted heme/steroid binding protein